MFFDPAYPSLKNGLVGYWSPVATGPTGLQLLDLSGQNNHGTLTNMDAPTDWVQSPYGTVLDFDGLSDVNNRDFVSLGNPIGLDKVQVGLSVFLWIRPTSVSGTRTIYGAYKSTSNSELYSMLRLEGTTLKYYTSTSVGGFQSVGTLTVTNNVWSLVGFTVSGTIASPVSTTFVNLASQANNLSALSATPADGVNFRIGAPQSAASSEAFQGQVAEACGWSRVLTLTENRELYRLGPGKLIRSKPTGGPSKRKWWPGVKTPKPRPIIPTQRGIKSGPVFYDPKAAWFKNGLVGHWCPSLTGATGTQLLDLSGQNNNGVLTNMDVPTDWVDSPYGTVLDFDGSNDFVDIDVIKPSSTMTVATWVYVRSFSNSPLIYTWIASSGAADYGFLETNSTGSQLFYGNRNTNTAETSFRTYTLSTALQANSWVNLVATKNAGADTGDLFVNGVKQTSFTGVLYATTSGATRLRLASYTSPQLPLNGQIAEICTYNRALTDSEIQQLYQAGPGGFASRKPYRRSSYSPAPKKIFKSRIDRKRSVSLVHPDHDHEWVTNGLVGFWCPSLTSPTGTQLLDLSGQNNNGVLTNMDVPTDWVTSGGKGALDFDGVNDYVSISALAPNASLRIGATGNPGTWCIWVYRTSTGGAAYFGENLWYCFNFTSTGATAGVWGLDCAVTGLALNRWDFIAVTFDGVSRVNALVNGLQNATATGTSAASYTNSFNVAIGARIIAGSYLPGQFDDFRIYNRVLTADEVAKLYAGGRGFGFSNKPSRSPTWMVEADETIGNRRRRIICGGKN